MNKDERKLATELAQQKLLLNRQRGEATRLKHNSVATRIDIICEHLQTVIEELQK